MKEFEKLRKYLLIAGLILACSAHLVIIGEDIQIYLLIGIIALTGVPHGSLDFFIERQSLINTNQKISISTFLKKYLLAMFGYGILWLLFPTLALIVFIGISAFHFGEIDWPQRGNTKLESVLYTVYGLLFISFILTSHINSAAPIFETITQKKFSTAFWLEWGALLFPYCCILLGLHIVILLMLHARLGWERKVILQFVLQSLVLVVIVYWLPLYLSFGFYFGLWHSLISFNLIRKQMKLSNDWLGWISMVKKAIPFTTIAWIGILLLIFISSTFQTEWLLLSNLFVGIAILTLPHLQVFTRIKFS